MASRFSIEATFKAIDRMSAPVKKMTGNTKKASTMIKRDFRRAQVSVNNFARSVKQRAAFAVKAFTFGSLAALGAGLGVATREFVNYDHAITAASAKFKGLNLNTAQGQETLKKLKQTARDVGAATQFSATEAAQGLDFLAMAGFNAEQAIASLGGVTDLATVANVDLATATDIASDALGAYGLMTDNAAQLQTNLNRVNDVAAKTTTMFNTDLNTLFESIKSGAPTFTNAGQSMETFSALAGAMANAGIKGSESGTVLRNVMLRLADPTAEAASVMNQLGIQTRDNQGNFRDTIDILADFENATKNMGTAERSAALARVFGARSIGGVNVLLAEGADKLRDYRKTLEQSTGASQEMANVMRASLANQFKILQSSLIELGFKFVGAFEKDGAGALQKLTKAVQEFDPTPIINGVKFFIKVFKVLFKIVDFLLPVIIGLTSAFMIYKTVMIAAAIKTAIFNAVLYANPIGLIILAIIALVGLLVAFIRMIWKSRDAIINFVKSAISFIGELFTKIRDWFANSQLGQTIATVLKIAFWPITLAVFAIQKLIGGVKWVMDNAGAIKDAVGGKISGAWDATKNFFGGGDDSESADQTPAAGSVTTERAENRVVNENRTVNEVIIRNQSNGDVNVGTDRVGAGTSIRLQPSGA